MGEQILKGAPRSLVAVVIPARYASSRFPGKPLARLGSSTLIQQVYERVRLVRGVASIVVATDDGRIRDVVKGFGGDVVLTGPELRTGSDRVAEVARTVPADVYINLQGDEIPLDPGLLEDLIRPFLESDAEIGTLKFAISDEKDLLNPHVVKVVTDHRGTALYFSRSPIPYRRDRGDGASGLIPGQHWKHVGIYAYTKAALGRFARLAAGALEEAEQLEQLRLLEAGEKIRVWETLHVSLRVDTPEDLAKAEHILIGGEPACRNSSL
jgi:3-deoxy-manno-octulosonate cytidylyltransferase (CMP-KDO synthetase)